MRIWPEKTQDQEFNELGSRGFKGSLNDRQFAYLLGAGYKGALADMMTSYRVYTPKLLFTGSEPGFWFDPSDLTTLYQDSAGTTPVTAAGQSVGLIRDKSGRGNHATAAGTKRPTYQIDASGRPYLSFDGVDDALVTSTITPGTDKVQVFAGVRKLSDAARGMLVESNNGSTNRFSIEAPPSGLKGYIGASGGSTVVFSLGTLEFAPDSAVLTLQGDISGDSVSLRRNGASATPATTDQGTGTYAASAINIGARAGTSLFFNGRLYGLIGRFGPNLSTERIKNTETWLNTKTGIY